MKKLFSILLAVVLMVSLSLVAALPALAAVWDITYTTQGTGTSSGISTDQAKFGDGSAKLALPADYTIAEYAHVTVEMPAIMVLNDFISGSYWYYPAAYQLDLTSSPTFYMKTGDSNGLAYPTGYMTFYLDTTGDGDTDVWVVQYEAFDTTRVWQQDSVSDSGGSFHVEGYTNAYNQSNAGTLLQVKGINDPDASATLGEAALLSVRVETGGWVASGDYTSNPLVTYIDDIEINGTTYELEPGSAVDLSATYSLPPPEQIGISVDQTSIGFGSVVPGVPSGPRMITVTNTGTVAEDFSASLTNISTPDVYTVGLTMNALSVGGWLPTGVAIGGTEVPPLVLTVPGGTAPGTYTATLIFWAEASP